MLNLFILVYVYCTKQKYVLKRFFRLSFVFDPQKNNIYQKLKRVGIYEHKSILYPYETAVYNENYIWCTDIMYFITHTNVSSFRDTLSVLVGQC